MLAIACNIRVQIQFRVAGETKLCGGDGLFSVCHRRGVRLGRGHLPLSEAWA